MASRRNLKPQVLQMRHEGLSYREIERRLNCSRGSINFICKQHEMVDIGKKLYPLSIELQNQIYEFCKTHSIQEAIKHFNVSLSSIKKYKKAPKTISE
jgi:transposase